jgi:hypothetical protein
MTSFLECLVDTDGVHRLSESLIGNSLIQNKKICLIACGSSAEKFTNAKDYDVVVGVNRIYQVQSIVKELDILYHNCSVWDLLGNFIKDLLTFNKNIIILGIPYKNKKHRSFINCKITESRFPESILILENLRSDLKKKYKTDIFSGTIALIHLLQFNPASIDIYGIDFYDSDYCYHLKHIKRPDITDKPYDPQQHNMKINRDLFDNILSTSNCRINHISDK